MRSIRAREPAASPVDARAPGDAPGTGVDESIGTFRVGVPEGDIWVLRRIFATFESLPAVSRCSGHWNAATSTERYSPSVPGG